MSDPWFRASALRIVFFASSTAFETARGTSAPSLADPDPVDLVADHDERVNENRRPPLDDLGHRVISIMRSL